MINSIRTEISKMIHNPFLWGALLIGFFIVSIDIYDNYNRILINDVLREGRSQYGFQGINLFVRWINVNMDTLGYAWYFFIFPILASLPYSWSCAEDLQTGYINQIVIHSNRIRCFLSKYIAVFISGFIVVFIPLGANLILNSLVCPNCVPNVTFMATPIWQGDMLSELFYTKPWLYSTATLLITSIWGSCCAIISFCSSFLIKKKAIAILFSFVLFVTIDYTIITIPTLISMPVMLSPLQLIHAATLKPNPFVLIIFIIGVIILTTSTIVVCRRKHEFLQ